MHGVYLLSGLPVIAKLVCACVIAFQASGYMLTYRFGEGGILVQSKKTANLMAHSKYRL